MGRSTIGHVAISFIPSKFWDHRSTYRVEQVEEQPHYKGVTVDHLTQERRSWLMSRVKGKDTTPEMRVRRAAHALGFRYSLHRKDLPGKPDLCFSRTKTAIFVHGCFWHRHEGCRKASLPKSRTEYWHQKFAANVERDEKAKIALSGLGWIVHIIWECQTKSDIELRERLLEILTSKSLS